MNIPPDAVTGSTLLGLHLVDKPPETPIPLSMIGKAYQLSLDGADLTGLARVTLPLPANVDADQYELGAYRWNGHTWERMSSRLSERGLSFGTDKPGGFAVLGQWRGADVEANLTVQGAEAGRETIPVKVEGEYRYLSLPTSSTITQRPTCA